MRLNALGAGPAWPTCDASGKKVFMDVSVAFGGGNTALTVEPAKVDALSALERGTAATRDAAESAQRRRLVTVIAGAG